MEVIVFILSLMVGIGVGLYFAACMLDKSNNLGDFSGTVDSLSATGVVFTNKQDRVKKKTPIDYYFPGCPFRVNGR